MGEKKEVASKKGGASVGAKWHLLEDDVSPSEELKSFLLPGEHVVYNAEDMFFTNKRIIKHRADWWARTFHFFYSTFEDIDLRHLTGMKAKNVINLRLFFCGLAVMFLGPIAFFFSVVPGLGGLGRFLNIYFVEGLGLPGLFLVGFVLVFCSLILRDRVIEFYSHGLVIRTCHFHDEELVKVRELQHLRLSRLGLDK